MKIGTSTSVYFAGDERKRLGTEKTVANDWLNAAVKRGKATFDPGHKVPSQSLSLKQRIDKTFMLSEIAEGVKKLLG